MPVLSENLIAYYEANAADPTADSWGSYNVTLNSISSQPGQFAESWGYSNSFDSANTGSTPNVGTYTIMGWGFNIRNAGEAVFSSNGASFTSEWFHMYINASGELGTLNFSVFTGSGYTVPSLSGWHHYTVTRDNASGNVTFYIDGVQVGSTITPAFSGNFSVQLVGSDPGATDYRWAERIDDYAIWNRTLDATEINTIYTEGVAGNSLRSLIGPSLLRGQFGAILHTVAASDALLAGQFGSVLHSTQPLDARLEGQFGAVLHSVSALDARLEGQFGCVLHSDAPPPSGGGGGTPSQGSNLQGTTLQGVLLQGFPLQGA